MIRILRTLFSISIVTCSHFVLAQQHSVLSTGVWYKFGVTESNMYQLTGNNLENNGISVSSLNSSQIRIFGHKGGMLPQENSTPRYSDLQELAIKVEDGGDGIFDSNDKIIFWAEGPDKVEFNESLKTVNYENNIYSDTSYFFLNINQETGKRITSNPVIPGSFAVVDNHIAIFIHELDQINILHSGRQWYGESFDQTLTRSFETNTNSWIEGSTGYLTSSVMAASYSDSKFTIGYNGNQIGTQQIYKIPESTYAVKGEENTTTLPFTLGPPTGANIEIEYLFEKQSGIGYLNYFVLQIQQRNNYNGSPKTLLIPKQIDAYSSIEVNNINSSIKIWDVSDFYNVKDISYQVSADMLTANIASNTTTWLEIFDPTTELPTPQFVHEVKNQDLHGDQNIDLLIVTSPLFLNEAKELEYFKIINGISAIAVTTNQIYNEFSAGRQDVSAIRDYAKYLYDNAGLKHILLFGKGTYDYKDIEGKHTSFVPIYESRNSLSPLYTYGSDDYYGFMETDEGLWQESSLGDHTLDIGVGRLPVKSVEEAQAVVNKQKLYKSKNTIGNWKKRVLFVAENGDGNLHQRDAEKLAVLVDSTYEEFDPQKIYVDAYPIEVLPSTTKAPLVNQAIEEALENGTFIVNYTGHGNEHQWAKSNIFNQSMIEALTNNPLLPLFVTATCEFGRHDHTSDISGGEELVIMPNNGAIGLITTSRPVFAPTNYALNLAFYNSVFKKVNGSYQSLGEIFKETKNNSLNGVNNRNFSLLADPSLTLAYPAKSIKIDSLNHFALQPSDTIRALEKVSFDGTIRKINGEIDASFSGKVYITFWDKPVIAQTLGNLGSPFIYSDRSSALFKGSSNVLDGNFNFDFVVSSDIDYLFDRGKVSMYAISNDSTDAIGASVSIIVGGSSKNPIIDSTPPEVNLFMNDSSFQNNDLVSTNSLLIANIHDENGINLTNTQIGHDISYSLDNSDPMVVNEYFEYQKGSYQSGKLLVPINNLTAGQHSLKLKVWDTSNNLTEEEILFRVGSDNLVVITDVSTYPNPIQDHANFVFKHNLKGENINVTLNIINRLGELVYSKEYQYINPNSIINDIEWDGRNSTGQKLVEGIYIYGIKIRSNDSGANSSYFGRIMIIN